jgi:hypothetical protein
MVDTAFLNAGADGAAVNLEGAWFALHDDDTAGSQVSAERLQPVYDPAVGGVADIAATLSFTGAASADCTHVGVWTDPAAGSFRGARPLTGDQTFSADGTYDLESAEIPATLGP